MVSTVQLWERLFYSITGERELMQGHKVINKFQVGEKTVGGQIYNEARLGNGEIVKEIFTIFPNGHIGHESRTYAPNSGLLKAYASIHTSHGDIPTISGTENFENNTENIIAAAKNMYAEEGYRNAINLDTLPNK